MNTNATINSDDTLTYFLTADLNNSSLPQEVVYTVPAICKETEKLLKLWEVEELAEDFARKGIDLEVLNNLTSDDINKLIPDELFGLRIKFRTRLFKWRSENKLIQIEEGSSSASFVHSWINSTPSARSSPHNYDANVPSPSHSESSLDVKSLLGSSISGRSVLANYQKDNILKKSDRQFIVNAVCDYWVNLNKQIIESDYIKATKQIKSLFPTEEENIYLGQPGQRGKLKEKFYGLCKKYQKIGLFKSRYQLKRKISENLSGVEDIVSDNLDNIVEISEDIEAHLTWLKNNITPESIVIDKWNLTFNYRRKGILDKSLNLFAEWPILKQNIATTLIELDFERLYPSKNLELFSKWKSFADKVPKIYKGQIKDPKNKKLLSLLEKNINEDAKNYLLTILLCAVLIPQIVKLKESKIQWKPSIVDAQEALVIHVTERSYIQSKIDEKKRTYISQSTTIQPTIIVVGENVENLTSFYIYLNDVLYPAPSFLKALSVAFQMHQVLNLVYDQQCKQIWNFLEEYFYDFSPKGSKTSGLGALLSDLKNTKT